MYNVDRKVYNLISFNCCFIRNNLFSHEATLELVLLVHPFVHLSVHSSVMVIQSVKIKHQNQASKPSIKTKRQNQASKPSITTKYHKQASKSSTIKSLKHCFATILIKRPKYCFIGILNKAFCPLTNPPPPSGKSQKTNFF